MKKMRVFLSIMIAVSGVFFFSQCNKKDLDCTLRLTCRYPSGDTVRNAIIAFDLSRYDTTNHRIDTLISRVNDTLIIDGDPLTIESIPDSTLFKVQNNYQIVKYSTKEEGVFTYTLPYPALLVVNAVKVDTTHDQSGRIKYVRYKGTTQVKLDEGEITDVKLPIRSN